MILLACCPKGVLAGIRVNLDDVYILWKLQVQFAITEDEQGEFCIVQKRVEAQLSAGAACTVVLAG